MECVEEEPNVKIFNGIFFSNFDEIAKNIKYMYENKDIISTNSGIIIREYSTSAEDDEIDEDAKYSIVYLGECENEVKRFYNLPENTELYI